MSNAVAEHFDKHIENLLTQLRIADSNQNLAMSSEIQDQIYLSIQEYVKTQGKVPHITLQKLSGYLKNNTPSVTWV